VTVEPKSEVELPAVDGSEHIAIFAHRKLVRANVDEFMQRYLAD
jgi:hypothetical protein